MSMDKVREIQNRKQGFQVEFEFESNYKYSVKSIKGTSHETIILKFE
jgi:hypothetical protein